MKKLLMALAFAGVALGANAQDADPVLKYSVATNSFWSNWFIQVGGDFNSWISDQEHGRGLDNGDNYGLFAGDRTSWGGAIAVGKWFTPGLGLRTKLQAWNAKEVGPTNPTQKFKYWTLNEQVLFNVSNMLCGYNEARVWDCIPYVGVGLNRNMSANCYSPVAGVGLLNEFKINNKWAINLDVNYTLGDNDYDGATELLDGAKKTSSHSLSKIVARHDRALNVEVGVTYNLGKATWNKVPDVDAINALHQSELDALNAKLNDANAENDRLKDLLANQKPVETVTPKTVKEFVTTPVSVFFDINKTNVASQYDLVNVRALAKYAIANNSNLLVSGYADKATGNEQINQKLSEGRAETVAGELVKMGVKRANITTKGNGGVDDMSPISFNRRATVQVIE